MKTGPYIRSFHGRGTLKNPSFSTTSDRSLNETFLGCLSVIISILVISFIYVFLYFFLSCPFACACILSLTLLKK